ncbi:Mitochondrial genome maintenance exonuclease 1 [Anthophora plagiata]
MKSFPIFGNEVTKNCIIQCTTKGSCLNIPGVTYILKNTMSETSESSDKYRTSIKGFTKTIHAIETCVIHPTLRYMGRVDCIASYRNQLYIIEWKKSTKLKTSFEQTFDVPIQLAAYIGAINASNNYPFRIDRGLVVVAYESGEPATVHELKDSSLQKSWEEWLRRLEQLYQNLNKI